MVGGDDGDLGTADGVVVVLFGPRGGDNCYP